ncbi:MAG: hypothetical protein KatS3mg082_2494 [Nitrospiraceae bacterium]|nr:MAG: hypothetical protein KatS3mg082_2494 [Nitrospiraceae bacterium]
MPKIVILRNYNWFARIILSRLSAPESNLTVVQISGDYRAQTGLQSIFQLSTNMAFPYFLYKATTTLLTQHLNVYWDPVTSPSPVYRELYAPPPTLVVASCRSPFVRSFLSSISPDILLSVSCPQKIPPEFWESGISHALNVHCSLLPEFKVLAPYFCVLRHGQTATGVSVHSLTPKFDQGDIYAQTIVPIR